MKQPAKPNFRRLIIFAVALIVLSTALIFWAKDIIREVIVLPLSYLFWLFGIIIRVTPQIFFWVVLILIVLQIAWRVLFGRKKVYTQGPAFLDASLYISSNGRASYWKNKVELLRSSHSNYYANSFYSALSRLVLDTLAYRYRQPLSVIEAQLKDGTLSIPDEVRNYLLTHNGRQEAVYRGFFGEIWQSFTNNVLDLWSRITARYRPEPAPVDPQLAYILNYLEEELEVPHDDSGY